MDLNTYQIEARTTAQYPNVGDNFNYPTLGLVGEFGELAEKFKKLMRDDNNIITDKKKDEITKEAGDCMWYISNLLSELDLDLIETNTIRSRYINTKEKFNRGYIDTILAMCRHVCAITTTIQEMRISQIITQKNKDCILRCSSYLIYLLERLLMQLDLSLNYVLQTNIDKLKDRQKRNVISGSGDNR